MLRNIVITQQLFVEHLLYLTALQDIDTLSVNKTKTHTKKLTLNGFIYMDIFPCLYAHIYLLFYSCLLYGCITSCLTILLFMNI